MTDVSYVSDESIEETDEHVMVIGDFIKITSQDSELNSVWKIEYISPEYKGILLSYEIQNKNIINWSADVFVINPKMIG